jgi:hypothetical protein
MVQGSIIVSGQRYETPNNMLVSKTTDEGLSWQVTELTSGTAVAYALAAHPNNKNILFTGGYEYSTGGDQYALFQTTNAGSNWTRINLDGSGQIRVIAFDCKNTSRVYAGSSNGVWTSTDGGTTWQKPSQVFWVGCLAADPSTAGKVYAGTSSGVFVSTNGGQAWSSINTGLTKTMIVCLDADPAANVLYAGTQGGGVFRLSLTTGVDDRGGSEIVPGEYAIHSAYPNPFNSTVRIRYHVPGPANVRVEIIDVNGKIIRVLSDRDENPGEKTAVWDGADGSGCPAPSGVYACRLVSKFGTTVLKMSLQK